MITAYEIQTYKGGQWKIDSVFDDKEIATFEAQRLTQSERYVGVRVVEERFDEATQAHTTRIVYKNSRVETENIVAQNKAREAKKQAEVEKKKILTERERKQAVAHQQKVKKQETWFWVSLGLKLGGLAAAGVALVVLLRYVSLSM